MQKSKILLKRVGRAKRVVSNFLHHEIEFCILYNYPNKIYFCYLYIIIFFLCELNIYYYKFNIYTNVLNPIEIQEKVFIFSSVLDKNRLRILLFINTINKSQLLENINCIFTGNKVLYSKTILVQYKAVHEKYYNLFCNIPNSKIEKYNIYISNKKIMFFNNFKSIGKYSLLFCLTTVFSYNNTKRFIEFIEYYRNFGVDQFIVYNTNCSNQIEDIFKYYINLRIMDVIYDNFTHNLYEKKRFHSWKHNDCFHKYKYTAKRIIFTDHDEIIYSPLYSKGDAFFSHLNQNAASYHFYPKLTITNGKGFFQNGYYSICPYKLWKYVINNPLCILHVTIHSVILERKCFKETVPISLGYILHARNKPSYHAKACKNWTFENNIL